MNLTEHLIARMISAAGVAWTTKIDYDGGTLPVYLAFKPRNASTTTASSVWTIYKFTYDGDNQLTDITSSPANTAVYDDRATTTYI